MKKMSVRAKKIIALITLVVVIALPIAVFAASYTSTLSLLSSWSGTTRYYAGANITYEATAYSDTKNYPTFDQNYYVTLYRDNRFFDDTIGQVTCPNNGYAKRTWTNVGNGNYYFYFSKQGNGIWVYSDDVKMYN